MSKISLPERNFQKKKKEKNCRRNAEYKEIDRFEKMHVLAYLCRIVGTRNAVKYRCRQTGLVVNRSCIQGYSRGPRDKKSKGKTKVDLLYVTALQTYRTNGKKNK